MQREGGWCHLDESYDFGAMMIECQGRVDRDTDVDELGDLVDGEGDGVERKVVSNGPLCDTTGRVDRTGFMKDHDMGFGT